MKKLLCAAALAAVSATAIPAEVGMSVSIGQPGFYGQIDIGGYPAPQLIYRQPRVAYYVPDDRPPLYLHVPPGHAKNWSKNCSKYNACNERVFFVKDSWYHEQYAPRYQEHSNRQRDDRRDDERNNRNNQERNHDRNR